MSIEQCRRWWTDNVINLAIRRMITLGVLPDVEFDVSRMQDADIQRIANLAERLPEVSLATIIKDLAEMNAMGRPMSRARRFLFRKRRRTYRPVDFTSLGLPTL